MSELKGMPYVTVEQVHSFREAALERIADLEARLADSEAELDECHQEIVSLQQCDCIERGA